MTDVTHRPPKRDDIVEAYAQATPTFHDAVGTSNPLKFRLLDARDGGFIGRAHSDIKAFNGRLFKLYMAVDNDTGEFVFTFVDRF